MGTAAKEFMLLDSAETSDALMTARDVSKRLRVSIRRVHQLELPKIRLGTRTVRFRERDVAALIDSRTTAL
jgi:predicted DNA-binding transcriptional regulator AlpA